jgi:hypothetical protein
MDAMKIMLGNTKLNNSSLPLFHREVKNHDARLAGKKKKNVSGIRIHICIPDSFYSQLALLLLLPL